MVDNAVLRFTIQQKINSKPDTLKKQNSIISHQSKLLEKRGNTIFSYEFVQKNSVLFQAYLERISDFLLAGKDVWWSWVEGCIEFYDGEDEPCRRQEGPEIHSFTSFNLHRETSFLASCWETCVVNFAEGLLKLPIKRIKVYNENETKFIYPPNGKYNYQNISLLLKRTFNVILKL